MAPVSPNNRLKSGLAAGAFGLLIVGLGGWWFTFAVSLIVHLALLEFFRMAQFAGIRPATKTTLLACQLLIFSTQLAAIGILSTDFTSAVLPLSGAAICGWLLLQPITGSIADIAVSIFGLFYLGFLPSHWLKLRNITSPDLTPNLTLITERWVDFLTPGMTITLMACLIIVSSDIGSYFLGKNYGRLPLSPISPGKTIEGAIGGGICAIIMGGINGSIIGWPYGFLIGGILGGLVALFALVGDLTESMMKRNAGLKDSGAALPGHGGILDRIDSYLFTPAVVYYSINLVLPLFFANN
ncbi:phosphatidate cytidylyltransferase [Prochlorococcus sp. MIT 1341]|uniref:phosphatidate cytidylyltransferase n=1 Tax=Prochlorococcus sp. MIT 1341 TaxID=3096221 RepID=UPI002A74773B|nr:phosphatidate cytidylyltransferase [Prochlorococcus sp. MIT 1341]